MANVYVDSNAAGAGTGADWANAFTTIVAAFAAKAAGDTFFVAHNHNESQASAMVINSPGVASNPCFVYCVNSAGSVPPVSADLRTTAAISTTGNNQMSIGNATSTSTYFYGIIFNSGDGANAVQLQVGLAAASIWLYFKNCQLNRLGTTTAKITFGSANGGNAVKVTLDGTTVKFGATGDGINFRSCDFVWKNTASAIQGATLPTTLFNAGSAADLGGITLLEGVDLSALGSGKTLVGSNIASARRFLFKDCQLGASVAIAATPVGAGAAEVVIVRTDSGGTNYRSEKYQYMGTQTTEIVLVRTGGASDGTTPLSWKIVATANSKWVLPFEAMAAAIWNDVSAANVTVTMQGLQDPRTSTALPNTDDVWIDVEYLGASGNPLGSLATSNKADGLASGSALVASTQAWDSLVTARASGQAYSLGALIKVATNPGRVFVCTTAGTSAGSEPGGYASAVDGGAVVDNTATFTAAVRFRMAVTLSAPQPGQKGSLYVYPKAAKANGIYYLDPLLALS